MRSDTFRASDEAALSFRVLLISADGNSLAT